jgi:hypothetical protein
MSGMRIAGRVDAGGALAETEDALQAVEQVHALGPGLAFVGEDDRDVHGELVAHARGRLDGSWRRSRCG